MSMMWRYLHGSVLSSAPANYASVVLNDHPVGYWRMDAASGTTEADASGNGHSGTITGGVTLNQAGAISDGDAAELFDGSTGVITLASTIATGTTCSFECWLKPDSTQSANFGAIFSDAADNTPIGYDKATAKIDAFYSSAHHRGNTALTDGQWYHVVVSISSGAGTFYLNGVADGTFSSFPGFTFSNIGLAGQDKLKGTLDEVAVYNVAFTPAQILNHYTVAKN